jgi:hypothetical protein
VVQHFPSSLNASTEQFHIRRLDGDVPAYLVQINPDKEWSFFRVALSTSIASSRSGIEV